MSEPTDIEFRDQCKPKHFDIDHYLDSVEQMVCADEVITALEMLKKVPGYYRDYPVPRQLSLEKEILAHTWTVIDYAQDPDEMEDPIVEMQKKLYPDRDIKDLGDLIDIPFFLIRGQHVINWVKEQNDLGLTPHIFELSPASFWLPYGLVKKGLKFTYQAQSLQRSSWNHHKQSLTNIGIWKNYEDLEPQCTNTEVKTRTLFCCFETLEHLWREDDIYHEYCKLKYEPDCIMMSTPKHTLFGGEKDWRREIGHLRTYTPHEFATIAVKWFPQKKFTFFDGPMMSLIGR